LLPQSEILQSQRAAALECRDERAQEWQQHVGNLGTATHTESSLTTADE
jgi:hypothetical protein